MTELTERRKALEVPGWRIIYMGLNSNGEWGARASRGKLFLLYYRDDEQTALLAAIAAAEAIEETHRHEASRSSA